MMQIGIVEDHQLVRDSFKKLLELQHGWQVVIEACNEEEAKLAIEVEKPAIFIVDISLSDNQTSFNFLAHLREHHPDIKVIIASMYDHDPYVSQAMRLGALGYVSKRSASEEMIDAVRAVSQGQRYLSDDVSFSKEPNVDICIDSLTNRELQALPLLAKGLNAKQVAQELGMMPKTAHVHKANIYSKLGVSTSFELLKIAINFGVIQLDELA